MPGENERSYIYTVERDMKTHLIITVIPKTEAVGKLKPEKIPAFTGVRPMTCAMMVQCSTN